MECIIRETLEASVEVTDTAQAEEMYNNEEVVLDYNNLVSTEFIPADRPVLVVLLDSKNGTVNMYHLRDEPDDVESWLAETYSDFDSNCSWIVTRTREEHYYE